MSGKVGSITTSIITDGLILNYDTANRASYPKTGTIINDTIGDNNGTLSGTTFQNVNSGIFNFDGTDDVIQLSSTVNLGTVYSVSFWFKTTQSQSSNGCWLASGSGNGFTMLLLRNNRIMFFRGVGTDYNYSVESLSYNDGNWHNLILTRNGTSTISMHLDATDISFSNAYGSGNLDTQLTFIGDDGGTWGTAVPYDGQLGPTTFYNRALSPTEILHNYNALKGRFN